MSAPRRARSILLVMTVPLAACEIARTPQPAVIDADSVARVEIRTALDDYHDALLAGDAAGAASFFTSDSRLYRPDSPDVIGAAAVRDAMNVLLDSASITAIALERDRIDVVRSGGAWELGAYAETFRVAGGLEQTTRVRYMIRWRRGPEGRWVIDTFMVNHYPPDSAATR